MKNLTLVVAAAVPLTCAMTELSGMKPVAVKRTVATGELENGLTNTISPTDKPKGQSDFHSLHDERAMPGLDAQKTLAHFIVHQALNGSQLLSGKQMLKYLENVGVKLYANLNARTNWDMSSVMLKDVPNQRVGIMDSALLSLHDW